MLGWLHQARKLRRKAGLKLPTKGMPGNLLSPRWWLSPKKKRKRRRGTHSKRSRRTVYRHPGCMQHQTYAPRHGATMRAADGKASRADRSASIGGPPTRRSGAAAHLAWSAHRSGSSPSRTVSEPPPDDLMVLSPSVPGRPRPRLYCGLSLGVSCQGDLLHRDFIIGGSGQEFRVVTVRPFTEEVS
jgi:hypothetical protein